MTSLCSPGMIFTDEAIKDWPRPLRGFLYALGMVYFFLGVAIVADLFMAAIDKVTSRRRKMMGPNGRAITVKVWNETVATLTLMALGSSAPEIFLSVIDIVKKKFHFGALGPATIVGSAAFNLLVIVAVCICIIPSEEVRIISNLPAFYITAFFSMIAYVWMAVILAGNTPQIVDVWEALVTFLLLPMLIYVSYKVDRGDANGVLVKLRLISEEEDGEAADTSAGLLAFSTEYFKVAGAATETNLEVIVVRRGGKAGALVPLSCSFHTEPMSAAPGVDFKETEGTLEMEEDQLEARIQLSIPQRSRRLNDVEFLLVLEDAEGGPGFDPTDDGGEDSAIMTVMVERHGPEGAAWLRAFDRHIGLAHLQQGMLEWRDQILCSIYCNGSREEQAEASISDWVLHIIALPWKVIFSALPPVNMGGGWACFYGSLGGIAILTTGVSDLAELFGCALDVPAIVTAVTFVALGTSMPDLFASLSAAQEDPTADASIVNVTGSNSVNVFLGLGVPWTIAAVYWAINGRTAEWEGMYPEVASRTSGAAFVVEAENLGFSVGAFCYVCILALVLLYFRRKWVGAELGGPLAAKLSSGVSLVSFWVLWVALISWRVLRMDEASSTEVGTISVASLVLSVGLMVTPLLFLRHASLPKNKDESAAEEEGAKATKADTGGTGNMVIVVDMDSDEVKVKAAQDAALEQAAKCNDSTSKASAPCSAGTVEEDGRARNVEEAEASWDDTGAEAVAQEGEREPPGTAVFRTASALRG